VNLATNEVTFSFTILLRKVLIAWIGVMVAVATGYAATEYVEGEALVTFKEAADLPAVQQALDKHALSLAKYFKELSEHRHRQTGLVRWPGHTTAALIDELKQDASVETVEPNYLRWASAPPPTNCVLFAQQWGLQNTGQVVNGTAGTAGDDIRFVSAWNLAQPAAGEVVVAVIDTGVDYTHPDLVSNMWTNPGGIPGDSYVDDYYGYDFADKLPDPMDSGFHGTHVAGTIAATGIPLGVVGVNNQARIMALKVSKDGETFTDDAVIEAIQYATMMKNGGVNVVAINASFGGGGSDSVEESAIQAAGDAGIVFCAAAGNDSADNDATPTYPANYRLANMIVVAASDQNDALASFSNYGMRTVDLAAPGVNILSTIPVALGGTTAVVRRASVTYAANGLTYAGTTTGITAAVYDCGLGYSGNFPAAVSGNIALIERGTLYFTNKVSNAMAAGALAAIIYNDVAGNFTGTLQYASNWIPAVSISQADGQTLQSLLPTTVTVVNSRDPTQIYQYADGTSMATPHVAGAVAFAAMNYPAETVAQRIQRLLGNVDVVTGLQTRVQTGGRLDLSRSVQSPVIITEPVITNALLSLPDLAVVPGGTNVAFLVTAADSDGDPLTYQWAFGDGTGSTEPMPWHTYETNTCGVYTATVVVADGVMSSPTGTLRVAVACPLDITQMRLEPNFARSNADSCALRAAFVPGADFSSAGQPVTVDIGDALVNFVLNKTGHGAGTNGTCTVSYNKQRGWTIAFALKAGAWHQAWTGYDLLDVTIKKGVKVQVPVVLLIGNDAYAADQPLTYTATAGESGTAK
jgi:subtilisin family serine protease